MARKKMDIVKIGLIAGAVGGGIYAFNRIQKARTSTAEAEAKMIEAKAKEQAAAKEPAQSIVGTLIGHPDIQQRISEVGTKATGFVKDLIGKLGISL